MDLVDCAACGNFRAKGALFCPHCGDGHNRTLDIQDALARIEQQNAQALEIFQRISMRQFEAAESLKNILSFMPWFFVVSLLFMARYFGYL
jgi:uncharacterized Zn finger protein (UPF0148 family)